MKKVTTENFIIKAQSIYNDLYSYDKVNYVSAKTKVIITCKIHGDFTITPNKHLSGGGCQVCGRNKIIAANTKTNEDFLNEAHEVHGELYDYSKFINVKRSEKITIICKAHGEFKQTISNHLSGQGCPTCAKNERGINRRKSEKDFFDDCNYIHNKKYNYSETTYQGMNSIIEPICPIHGSFKVLAIKHYHRNQGCTHCSDEQLKSRPILEMEQYLNDNNIIFISEFRIKECRNVLELPFDIYIPSLNLCVEYDGVQHYKPIEFFGGEEGYQKQVQNDKIKNEYCESNNINLLRISYKQEHLKVLKEYLEKS